jgi:uncharacterized membrane protein YqjE
MARRSFEQRINALSDQDWAWWPLLALRPRREQDLSEARLLAVALLFGGFCAAASVLLLYLLFDDLLVLAALSVAALTFVVFYISARFTLQRSWNRRAARLRAELARGE